MGGSFSTHAHIINAGKRPRGRSIRRWKDNTKVDVKEIGETMGTGFVSSGVRAIERGSSFDTCMLHKRRGISSVVE
jgi:hypothetical protein